MKKSDRQALPEPAGEISYRQRGEIDRYAQPGERRQPMRGFDPEYSDIVDYIIRCTHRIWEEKAVGLIYTHYQHNAVTHVGYGATLHSREEVVASTLQTLAAFPDRKIYGNDVIWSGNEDDGFHTSHLIMSVGRNTGYSKYGPPTGRRAVWRAIANCFVRENRIIKEWLLRDETYLIRQLGFDVNEIAERQARAQLLNGAPPPLASDLFRSIGQCAPPVMPPRTAEGFDVEDFVRRSYHEVWNWRLLNAIRRDYAESFECHTSGGRRLVGHGEYTQFVLEMLSMFTDGMMTIDHLDWNGDERDGFRVAARWTFTGTHDEHGIYGPPSGARVRIMGLSHHRIRNGQFHEEHGLFDEFALIQQIALKRLSVQ